MAGFAHSHAGEEPGRGDFGRLFQRRQNPVNDDMLVAIAATMSEGMSLGLTAAQVSMPSAGYTYLGQFIDHDLTSDTRLFSAPVAAGNVVNRRTSRFDLDSVYSDGPSRRGDLYDGDRLRLAPSMLDLARHPDGTSCIKDRRNDSNRILSQLHVAFLRFHNRVVDQLPAGSGRFHSARTIVQRHYQWVIVHDFLPIIVGAEVVDGILRAPGGAAAGLKLAALLPLPLTHVPLEFSAAAFRFGHSMVRSAYQLNATSGQLLTFDAAMPWGSEANDLRGFRPLPPELAVGWEMFFRMPGSTRAPQQARPIDTLLAGPLFKLPVQVADDDTPKGRLLPYRNLHRSEVDLGLPTGQQVAHAMREKQVPGTDKPLLGVEIPIVVNGVVQGETNLGGSGIGKAQLEQSLNDGAPLWYYILMEAEHLHHGLRLGTVGGRIVAEVIVALMLSDRSSVLNTGWMPTAGEFGCKQEGKYGIADLLGFAAI